MSKSGKSTKDARREAQERLAAERASQKAADRKRSLIFGAITVAVVVLIGIAVAISVNNANSAASNVNPLPKGVAEPGYGVQTGVGALDGGGNSAIPVKGEASGTVPTMDIYEDFQCPACRNFEAQNSATIDKLIEEGKVKVVFHPMSFLDRNLNNDSSLRAASASGCAADAGRFIPFHNEVYKNQPEREGTGFTDEQLIQFGRAAGITGPEFEACVNDQKYTNWATNGVQREAENRGVTSTPTVFIDGQELPRAQYTPQGITQAVADASK